MQDAQERRAETTWFRFAKEPLVHFLGLAALLFVAEAIFSGDERDVISIDYETQVARIQTQEDLLLRPLTEDERDGIVNTLVEEEILLREARARGYNNVSSIRTLMIQNMRFFLSRDLPAPSEEELQHYYAENRESYDMPASATYEHVLFLDADAVQPDVLESLNSGADFHQVGDRGGITAPPVWRLNRPAMVSVFGLEIANTVLAIDDEAWHGPFKSQMGVHFLRVRERHEGRSRNFEDVRKYVEDDWVFYASRERIEDAIADMSKQYVIDVEPAPLP